VQVIDNEPGPDRAVRRWLRNLRCICDGRRCGSATLALTRLRPPTHVHGRNMHARTHRRARAHARSREKDMYAAAHAVRTRNIRTRTCETPGSTYTRHSTFEPGNPHRTPPPCLAFLIYHGRPKMQSRVRRTCALVCIATPPHGPPATRLADRALAPCHTNGSRNAGIREPAP
jgi:hypothetical protein